MSDETTGRLLDQVFPGSRVGRPEYLRWLYRDSPFGPVIESNLDDATGRAAHYAVIPCTLSGPDGPVSAALSLNTAVHERARGEGVFTRLAEATFDEARARGVQAIVGVANSNSTPGFVQRLGFTLIGPLPATVLVPLPGRRGPRLAVRAAADVAGDPALASLLSASAGPVGAVHRAWTPSELSWRLASPGADYLVHSAQGLLVVTTAERRHGVNVAVILAIIADHPLARAERHAVVRSAGRAHRARLVLHVGLNNALTAAGVPLPGRLRPSPLNLIFRWLDDGGARAPQFDRFELLDFDAY